MKLKKGRRRGIPWMGVLAGPKPRMCNGGLALCLTPNESRREECRGNPTLAISCICKQMAVE